MDELEEELGLKDKPFAKIGQQAEDIKKASFSFEEMQKHTVKEHEFIMHPILTKKSSMMIFGEAGVGKSYFTMNLAYSLSCGGNFLNYKVPYPQKIAYFDGELGKDDVHRYIHDIAQFQGKTEFPGNLVFTSYDQFPNHHIPRIEDNTNSYFEYIMDNGFNGAVWDNLATCTDIDENDPKAWKPIQALVLRLRAHNVFVIFVHHSGSEKSKERGITARRDVLQLVVSLEKIEDFISLDNRIKVTYRKGRYLKGIDKQPFEAIHKIDGKWEMQTIEKSTYQAVVDCLLAGFTGAATSKEVKISPGMVTRYKQQAISEGKIKIYPNGRIVTQ